MRRTIFKAQDVAARELEVLVQNLLVLEILAPSQDLWVVSPWVSDIEVIDNRAAGFSAVEPLWPNRWIRLSEVIISLAQRGAHVVVAVRSDEHNLAFRRRLTAAAQDAAVEERIRIEVDDADEQHEKGLLGDDFFLSGSMNFTVRGLHVNGEIISLTRDPDEVAAARISLRERFAGGGA